MAKLTLTPDDRIFQYGIGAAKTVLILSQNVIHYRLERLNEAGNWSAVLERYFSPEQFGEFLTSLERSIPRTQVSFDRVRDSLDVSLYLAGDDLSKNQEASTPGDTE